MDRKPDLEQQLWDFVYELLPEAEAQALSQRISSDPDVARAYADVRLKADLLVRVTKLEADPISLTRPEDNASPPPMEPVAGLRPVGAGTVGARVANGLLALAAALLLAVLGFSYAGPDSPLNRTAATAALPTGADQPLRLTLIGPAQVPATTPAHVTVVARSDAGRPVATELNCRWLEADGRVVASAPARTDAFGVVQLKTPATVEPADLRLEVRPAAADDAAPLRQEFAAAPVPLATYVAVDKPSYRPGEVVRYRAQTLAPFAEDLAEEVTTQVRLLDPSGADLAGGEAVARTRQGVVYGEYQLPANVREGSYTLLASSPAGRFAAARREIPVRSEGPANEVAGPTLELAGDRLRFARDHFAAGEEVVATLSAKNAQGEPLPNAPVHAQAELDGEVLLNLFAVTDPSGDYQLKFALPESAKAQSGRIAVTVGDPPVDTVAAKIPLAADQTQVEFFPESGHLVAGVPNRMYYKASDARGQPRALQGSVVNDAGQRLAEVHTTALGRGVFRFTPPSDQVCRLQMEPPSGQAAAAVADAAPAAGPLLPAVSKLHFVTLEAVQSVLDEDQLCELQLHTTQPSRPLAIVATCRGVMVGQELVTSDSYASVEGKRSSCRVAVPLESQADGVIRLTAYDLSVVPPQPTAERSVFRRPARRLNIEVAPTEVAENRDREVCLAVRVRDERKQAQLATLGVSVLAIDRATAEPPLGGVATQVWLSDDCPPEPNSLAETNMVALLGRAPGLAGETGMALADALAATATGADDRPAREALDLLLGTRRPQLWRAAGSLLARDQREPVSSPEANAAGETFRRAESGLVVLAENRTEFRRDANREVLAFQAARELDVRQLGRLLFFGGVVVLIGLMALGLLRMSAGAKVWAPVLGAATACLLVGGLWMQAEIDGRGQVAWLPGQATPGSLQLAKVTEPTGDGGQDKRAAPADEAAQGLPAAPLAKAAAPAGETELADPYYDRASGEEAPPKRRASVTNSPETAAGGAAADEPPPEMPKPGGARRLAAESEKREGSQAQPQPEFFAQQKPADAKAALSSKDDRAKAANGNRGALAPASAAAAPAPAEPLKRGPGSESVLGTPALKSATVAPRAMAARTGPAALPPAAGAAPAPAAAPSMDDAASLDLDSKLRLSESDADHSQDKHSGAGLKPGADQPILASGGYGGGMGGMGGGMGGMPGKPLATAKAKRGAERLSSEPSDRGSDFKEQGGVKKQSSSVAGAPEPAAKPQEAKESEALAKQLHETQSPAAANARQLEQLDAQVFRKSLKQASVPAAETAGSLYWEPLLATDAEGQATIRFRLPPHVKAYRVRIDARATGRLGEAQLEFPAKPQ